VREEASPDEEVVRSAEVAGCASTDAEAKSEAVKAGEDDEVSDER